MHKWVIHVIKFLAEQRRKLQLDYLEYYQEILTPSAAIDIELFHIPGEGLFAVFANSDPGGGRSRGVSGLYKWVEKEFRLYQRLPSVSAQSWCHFKIKNNVRFVTQWFTDQNRETPQDNCAIVVKNI